MTLKVILRRWAEHYASAMLRIVSKYLNALLALDSRPRLYKKRMASHAHRRVDTVVTSALGKTTPICCAFDGLP